MQEKALALDRLGMAHRRLQQTHRGVPVLGGEAIVHLGADGVVRRVTDALVSRVQADTEPVLAFSPLVASTSWATRCSTA